MRERYEYNGFTYVKDNQQVKVKHNKKKPLSLYKYYALTEFSIDALHEGYLYASHPFELNDCLDVSSFLLITSERLSFEMYKELFKDCGFNQSELEDLFQEDSKRENLQYTTALWTRVSNLIGIISLSENESCPLMWPHYTQEKGFQLKFNSESLEECLRSYEKNGTFMGLHPINYTNRLDTIDISKFKEQSLPFHYIMNIKHERWKYENEWRALVSRRQMGIPFTKVGLSFQTDYETQKKNRYVYYDKNLIEQISLGNNFFNGRDFELKRIDGKKFLATPKNNSNIGYKNQCRFLDFIEINLKDKLFYSGVKYLKDENGKHYLARTNERFEIDKKGENEYLLTRTNEVNTFI